MKKWIVIVLTALMLVSFAACGNINDTQVAILWSGEGVVETPNSLINAMERAMYIQRIAYTHYGAGLDSAVQVQQAEEAVAAGCAALVVEPVDVAFADTFVELAKSKDIPVVFFNCRIDEPVVDSYSKCVVVSTKEESLADCYGEMIAEYLNEEKNVEKLDRNGDGKIKKVYLFEGEMAVKTAVEMETIFTADIDETVEMIVTNDEAQALDILLQLQAMDFNTDKLNTRYIAVFTVGNSLDYKEHVLASAPAEEAALAEYYEANKYLVDLTTVKAEDLEAMIYTTGNVIDSGRIAGTVLENQDAMAELVAEMTAILLKGQTPQNFMPKVPYATYMG